jgi:hypothetical protein
MAGGAFGLARLALDHRLGVAQLVGQVGSRLAELRQTLAERLGDIGQPLRAEDDERHHENDQELGHADAEHHNLDHRRYPASLGRSTSTRH